MPRDLTTLCLTFLTIFGFTGASSAQSSPVPVPPFLFPVAQGAQWEDTFGTPRSGHTHIGQDLMAPKMRPLVACFAGTVTLHSNKGSAGNWITLQGTGPSAGWRAEYMHLNNDTPGTNDGLGGDRYAFAPGLKTGDQVMAGQFLGYVGNSGNAESAGSHCHFELHGPDGPVNCALMLRAAKTLYSPQIVEIPQISAGTSITLSIIGTVLTVFPDQSEAMVKVTTVTESGGKPTPLDPPRVKRLVFSDREAFSALATGVLLTAEGKDLGQGKPLQVDRMTTIGAEIVEPNTTGAAAAPLSSVRKSTGSAPSRQILPSPVLSGRKVIDDFERGVYRNWETTGDCWGRSPELISDRLPVPGTSGRYFLSTAHPRPGDNRPASGTGIALSSEFSLTQPKLRFRIGGGNYPEECCLNLLIDGKIVRTETGSGTDRLLPVEWDVAEFVGKKARLQVVDKRDAGLRAYLLLDEIETADALSSTAAVETNAGAKYLPAPETILPAGPITVAEQTPGTPAFVLLPDGTKIEGTQLITMEATGYGPGDNGKWGDRTASGTKVGYGTVAVDPRIIPLKTHLWVEGYGFCIALDKGSAIKGMKIDLGHDSDAEAAAVGRKKLRVLVLD